MNTNPLQATIQNTANTKATIPIATNKNHLTTSASSSFATELASIQASSNIDLNTIFDQASDTYNVPKQLLLSVAKAESSFQSDATSYCGAQGIMQLMPNTAKGLGVTDAYDPEQNIMGGAKLLRQLLDKYNGDTNLALAGYNAGIGNVAKYGGIPPFKETQGYITKVMGYYTDGVSIPTNSFVVSAKDKTSSTTNTFPTNSGARNTNSTSSFFDDFTLEDYLNFIQDILMKLGTSLNDRSSQLNQKINNTTFTDRLSTTVTQLSDLIDNYNFSSSSKDATATNSFTANTETLVQSINQQLATSLNSIFTNYNNAYSYNPAIMSLLASSEKQ